MKSRGGFTLAGLTAGLAVMSAVLVPQVSWAFTLGLEVFARVDALACRGSSTRQGFEDHIIVRGFEGTTSRLFDPDTGQLSRRAQAEAQPLTLVKDFDGCTPALFRALVEGRLLPSVVVNFVAAAEDRAEVFFRIELRNAAVVGMKTTGGSTDLLEQVSFTFQQIQLTDTARGTTVTCDFVADRCS